jgi:hypothetical protein
MTVHESFGIVLNARSDFFGNYRVSGIVRVAGSTASRLVKLFEYPNLRLLAHTFSDQATGAYSFDNLPARPDGGAVYGVIGYDHTGQFDPECKIGFSVEAMP